MVLRIGQKVPNFSLPDCDGRERKLDDFLTKGPTVLAFFPFAFSGVCDREMCAFRDGIWKSGVAHGQIVGISVDSLYTLKVFAQTYDIQFTLLSDFNRKVSRMYGALDDVWVAHGYKGVSKRAVLVVDRRAVLRYRWIAESPSNEPPYDDVNSMVVRLNQ